MKDHRLPKHFLSLLILCLLCLSFIDSGVAQAQEPAPPPITRYQEFLPPEQLDDEPDLESAAPSQFDAASLIPDSEIVVFQSLQNRKDWNIYAINSGGEWIQITTEPSHEIHPRFNRGVTKVVFASNRTGRYELFVINLDGSGLVQLTATGSHNVNPAWSLDGRRIAFESYRDGQAEIYVMDADGGNVQRLTANPGYDGEPTWSPDGSQIAYVTEIGGAPYVWVVNADGSNARPLVNVVSIKPVWSPEGKEIVYAADDDGDGWFRLYLTAVDGSINRPIGPYSQHPLTDMIPQSFSPDGRYIAYTSISYVNYQGQWYWQRAIMQTCEYIHIFHCEEVELPNKGTEWNPDWQSYNNIAPRANLSALPAISPAEIVLSWQSAEGSHADVAGYHLQVRVGDNAPWVDLLADSLERQATYKGVAGQRYYFRLRARDRIYNREPWTETYHAVTTVESWPPRSQWRAMPRYSRKQSIDLNWFATDPGDSGIESYDVQVRRLPDDTWYDFQSQVDWTGFPFEGELGKSYEFRVRARDRAGNLEPWPTTTVRTTFYTWGIMGNIVDNAGATVTGATVTANPAAFELQADSSGAYAAYVANPYITDDGIEMTWHKQGYGPLPVTAFPQSKDAQRSIILPPANNLLANSHFEAQTLEGWQSSGDLPPALVRDQFHTGQASLFFGCPALTPAVNISRSHGDPFSHQFLIDAKGTAHLIWSSYGWSNIHYSQRLADGQWLTSEFVGDVYDWSNEYPSSQMVVDTDGTVHIVWAYQNPWFDNEEEERRIYYRKRSPSGVWSEKQLLSDAKVFGYTPRLGIDGSGRLHVAWEQIYTVSEDFPIELSRSIAYTSRHPSGQWTTPTEITDSKKNHVSVLHLKVSSEGIVHLLWYDNPDEDSDPRFNYRRMTSNGVWEAQQVIGYATRSALARPLAKLSTSGRLHVVWPENMPQGPNWHWRVSYRQLDPQGKWSESHLISPHAEVPEALAVNEKDEVALLLQNGSGGHLAIVERRQGTWSAPVLLSTEGVSGNADVTFDDTGALHAVWVDGYDTNGDLFYRRRNPDRLWLRAQSLAQSIWHEDLPQVAIGPQGALHIVWSNRSSLHAITTATSSGGSSALAQAVTIPAEMASPVLSFQYWADGFRPKGPSHFKVEVNDAHSNATLSTISANSNGWTHGWTDLSAWQGRPISITLRLDQTAGQPCASVLVDEVTLGSAYPDLWINGVSTSAAMPGQPVQYTLSYGNQGGGKSAARVSAVLPPQVSLVSATPSPTVNGKTLTWESGELPGHSQPAQIVITGIVDANTATMTNPKLVATIESTVTEQEKANNQTELPTFIGRRLYIPSVNRE